MFDNDSALFQFRLSKSHHGKFSFLKNYVFFVQLHFLVCIAYGRVMQ